MATQDIRIEGNTDTTAVACTLTSADLATQSDRWQQLGAQSMIERVETAHGLRISFRPDPGVEEELGKLVAVENECCSWADWTVETNAEQIVLDVRSTGEGIATLHGMFTGLQPVREGFSRDTEKEEVDLVDAIVPRRQQVPRVQCGSPA